MTATAAARAWTRATRSASTSCSLPVRPPRSRSRCSRSSGSKAELLAGVAAMGYDEPTPIQEQAIPRVLAGRDVVGCAQTGTGKTAAFVLPILQNMNEPMIVDGKKAHPTALVVTPTRELCGQIEEVGETLATYSGRRVVAVFGGVPLRPAGQAHPQGRRPAGRHPGPPARHAAPGRRPARQGRHPRPRRGRPHARHGLLAGRQAHHRRHPGQAAEPLLLGHHEQDRAQHHRRHAARPDLHRARRQRHAGGERRAEGPAGQPGPEGGAAGRVLQAPRPGAHAGLHAHAAPRRARCPTR